MIPTAFVLMAAVIVILAVLFFYSLAKAADDPYDDDMYDPHVFTPRCPFDDSWVDNEDVLL